MTLLKQYTTAHGVIRITRSPRDGTLAYFQNGCFHSQANRHGISVCVYTHAIQDLLRQNHARHVLIIGCAGGTLATMLHRQGCRVTAIDVNPVAFEIARRHFQLPASVTCVVRDGRSFLRTCRKTYDAVVLDVFDTDNQVPTAFTQTHFFALAQRALKPSGLIVMNLITANDRDRQADRVAQAAAITKRRILLFDWPHEQDRNTLLVIGGSRRLRLPSGHELPWIRDDFSGLLCRKPRHLRCR